MKITQGKYLIRRSEKTSEMLWTSSSFPTLTWKPRSPLSPGRGSLRLLRRPKQVVQRSAPPPLSPPPWLPLMWLPLFSPGVTMTHASFHHRALLTPNSCLRNVADAFPLRGSNSSLPRLSNLGPASFPALQIFPASATLGPASFCSTVSSTGPHGLCLHGFLEF